MTSKLFNLQICFETANGRMYFPVFSNLSFPYWPAESASPIPPALVWQSYRDFSRNLQLLSGLESRLGIEILEIERAEKTRTASRLERWFIVQTLIQLQETAAEALAEIRTLKNTLSSRVLDEPEYFEAQLRERIPDLAAETREQIFAILRAHGSVRDWFQTVTRLLTLRVEVYQDAASLMRGVPETGFASHTEPLRNMIRSLYRSDPELPEALAETITDADQQTAILAKELARARAAGKEAVAQGEPVTLARAEERRVVERVRVSFPRLAEDLEIEPRDPTPGLWCVIGGPCWWKVTGIAVAIAVSSHNVD